MRKTKYNAEILRPLVESSKSLAEVIRKLGLTPNGGNHRMLQARVRHAGLDTSHFGALTLRETVDRLPRELLKRLVAESRSLAAVLTQLSLATEGRAHHELKRRLAELDIDTSHFTGQAWSRGYTSETHPSLRESGKKRGYADDVVFVENSTPINGPNLVKRLVARGVHYACAICGLSEWCDRPLVLHIDHIHGINNDNRVENLRLLCPNCHSQTATYCNKAREEAACYTYGHASVAEWCTRQT